MTNMPNPSDSKLDYVIELRAMANQCIHAPKSKAFFDGAADEMSNIKSDLALRDKEIESLRETLKQSSGEVPVVGECIYCHAVKYDEHLPQCPMNTLHLGELRRQIHNLESDNQSHQRLVDSIRKSVTMGSDGRLEISDEEAFIQALSQPLNKESV